MEHQKEQEQEHEVFDGEIPDEGDMEADVEMFRAEEDHPNPKDLEDIKKILKEIKEEAGALGEMQAKVEKEMGAVQGKLSQQNIFFFTQIASSTREFSQCNSKKCIDFDIARQSSLCRSFVDSCLLLLVSILLGFSF